MSGLYNIVFGDGNEQRRGVIWGTLLDLELSDFGRFRDCWLERDEQGNLRIAYYTRVGGGNRPDYEQVINDLRAHPAYIADADDSFDSTYATFYFRFPDAPPQHLLDKDASWGAGWDEIHETASRNAETPRDMGQLWKEQTDRIQKEGPTERELAAFAPVMDAIRETLGDGEVKDVQIHTIGRDPKKEFDL